MKDKDEIAKKILGKTYDEYEKEKSFLIRVCEEIEPLSEHGDVYCDDSIKSYKLNNAKVKAKLRRLLDEKREKVEKTLKLKHKE